MIQTVKIVITTWNKNILLAQETRMFTRTHDHLTEDPNSLEEWVQSKINLLCQFKLQISLTYQEVTIRIWKH